MSIQKYPRLASFSWVLYDFANTIYSMNVVTLYFSLWITVNLARADLWVSISNSLSMALVAISLPVLGAFSDFRGKRLPFLWRFTLTCIFATGMIGILGYLLPNNTMQIVLAAICFVVANYSFQGALVFYNALMPVIAKPEKFGKISGYGVSMGYLGSIFGMLMVMPFVIGQISFLNIDFDLLQKEWQNIHIFSQPSNPLTSKTTFIDSTVTPNDNYQYRILIDSNNHRLPKQVGSKDTILTINQKHQRGIVVEIPREELSSNGTLILQRQISGWGRIGSFIPTGILFFIFAIPIFIFIREHTVPDGLTKPSIRQAFRDVINSLRDTRKYPGVLRFLIAKFFYEEAIETAIIFMAVFAVKVMGFSNEIIIPFFMITTTAAVFGSFAFGILTDRLGAKHTLMIVIGGWTVCLLAIILVQQQIWFWIIGSLVGVFLGSTWTSARPLLINLVPKEKLAEFFGLYAFSGKAAAIIGPLIWGIVVAILEPYGDSIRYRGAVFSLAVMMIIGFILLWKVPKGKMMTGMND